ncbi:MAG TPA: hypothetical protein VHD85_15570 [Terracidiphilus sp.]|nr:hypothetical protein [Terracidiphilus sp.]
MGSLRHRTRFSRSAWLSVAALVFTAAACAGAGTAMLEHPIMMDSNGPGTELYVLDDAGTIHKYRVSENGLSEYGRIAVPSDFVAADMTYARSETPESILMAGTQSGRGGVVLRLSLDSRTLKTWGFENICGGVDSGARNHTAYVATSDSNEIYKVDLRATGITPIAQIPDAVKLGPVAYDDAGQKIYVADVASGKVYEYSIATKSSRVFLTHLSAPSALVFDAETNRLFVADPGQRAIFVADAHAARPVAVPFVTGPLRAPYGMTLISGARVAVADHSLNSIFVFSNRGTLLFRFPAAQ